MRRALPHILATVLAAIAVAPADPLPATAAQPPRVQALNCRSVSASTSWWTVFHGERTNFWGYRESFNRSACFKSQKDCKAWLYWAQSDWPDMNRNQGCRKGKPR
jgi:hypothetical protein